MNDIEYLHLLFDINCKRFGNQIGVESDPFIKILTILKHLILDECLLVPISFLMNNDVVNPTFFCWN